MPTCEQISRHLDGNSRLTVIHNAGHAVNLEKPTEVCKCIIDFFQEPVPEASNDERVGFSASRASFYHLHVNNLLRRRSILDALRAVSSHPPSLRLAGVVGLALIEAADGVFFAGRRMVSSSLGIGIAVKTDTGKGEGEGVIVAFSPFYVEKYLM